MKLLLESLWDRTSAGLSKSLDLTWRRGQAIVSNISNAETPGYRAVDLNFAHELERAVEQGTTTLKTTSTKHMDAGGPKDAHLVPDLSGATKADGNNVDIDLQMGRLAFNSGKYSISANLMRKKLALLKTAIREGQR